MSEDGCTVCGAPCATCPTFPPGHLQWVGATWCDACAAFTHHTTDLHVPANLTAAWP